MKKPSFMYKLQAVSLTVIFFQVNVAWAAVPTMPLPSYTQPLFSKLAPISKSLAQLRLLNFDDFKTVIPAKAGISSIGSRIKSGMTSYASKMTALLPEDRDKVFVFNRVDDRWAMLPNRFVNPQNFGGRIVDDRRRMTDTHWSVRNVNNLPPSRLRTELQRAIRNRGGVTLTVGDLVNAARALGLGNSFVQSLERNFENGDTVAIGVNRRGEIIATAMSETKQARIVFTREDGGRLRPTINVTYRSGPGARVSFGRRLRAAIQSGTVRRVGGHLETRVWSGGSWVRVRMRARDNRLVVTGINSGSGWRAYDGTTQRSAPFIAEMEAGDVSYGIRHFSIRQDGSLEATGFLNVRQGMTLQDGNIHDPSGASAGGADIGGAISHNLDLTVQADGTIMLTGRAGGGQSAFSAVMDGGEAQIEPSAFRPVTAGSSNVIVRDHTGTVVAQSGRLGRVRGNGTSYFFSRWNVNRRPGRNLSDNSQAIVDHFSISERSSSLITADGVRVGQVQLNDRGRIVKIEGLNTAASRQAMINIAFNGNRGTFQAFQHRAAEGVEARARSFGQNIDIDDVRLRTMSINFQDNSVEMNFASSHGIFTATVGRSDRNRSAPAAVRNISVDRNMARSMMGETNFTTWRARSFTTARNTARRYGQNLRLTDSQVTSVTFGSDGSMDFKFSTPISGQADGVWSVQHTRAGTNRDGSVRWQSALSVDAPMMRRVMGWGNYNRLAGNSYRAVRRQATRFGQTADLTDAQVTGGTFNANGSVRMNFQAGDSTFSVDQRQESIRGGRTRTVYDFEGDATMTRMVMGAANFNNTERSSAIRLRSRARANGRNIDITQVRATGARIASNGQITFRLSYKIAPRHYATASVSWTKQPIPARGGGARAFRWVSNIRMDAHMARHVFGNRLDTMRTSAVTKAAARARSHGQTVDFSSSQVENVAVDDDGNATVYLSMQVNNVRQNWHAEFTKDEAGREQIALEFDIPLFTLVVGTRRANAGFDSATTALEAEGTRHGQTVDTSNAYGLAGRIEADGKGAMRLAVPMPGSSQVATFTATWIRQRDRTGRVVTRTTLKGDANAALLAYGQTNLAAAETSNINQFTARARSFGQVVNITNSRAIGFSTDAQGQSTLQMETDLGARGASRWQVNTVRRREADGRITTHASFELDASMMQMAMGRANFTRAVQQARMHVTADARTNHGRAVNLNDFRVIGGSLDSRGGVTVRFDKRMPDGTLRVLTVSRTNVQTEAAGTQQVFEYGGNVAMMEYALGAANFRAEGTRRIGIANGRSQGQINNRNTRVIGASVDRFGQVSYRMETTMPGGVRGNWSISLRTAPGPNGRTRTIPRIQADFNTLTYMLGSRMSTRRTLALSQLRARARNNANDLNLDDAIITGGVIDGSNRVSLNFQSEIGGVTSNFAVHMRYGPGRGGALGWQTSFQGDAAFMRAYMGGNEYRDQANRGVAAQRAAATTPGIGAGNTSAIGGSVSETGQVSIQYESRISLGVYANWSATERNVQNPTTGTVTKQTTFDGDVTFLRHHVGRAALSSMRTRATTFGDAQARGNGQGAFGMRLMGSQILGGSIDANGNLSLRLAYKSSDGGLGMWSYNEESYIDRRGRGQVRQFIEGDAKTIKGILGAATFTARQNEARTTGRGLTTRFGTPRRLADSSYAVGGRISQRGGLTLRMAALFTGGAGNGTFEGTWSVTFTRRVDAAGNRSWVRTVSQVDAFMLGQFRGVSNLRSNIRSSLARARSRAANGTNITDSNTTLLSGSFNEQGHMTLTFQTELGNGVIGQWSISWTPTWEGAANSGRFAWKVSFQMDASMMRTFFTPAQIRTRATAARARAVQIARANGMVGSIARLRSSELTGAQIDKDGDATFQFRTDSGTGSYGQWSATFASNGRGGLDVSLALDSTSLIEMYGIVRAGRLQTQGLRDARARVEASPNSTVDGADVDLAGAELVGLSVDARGVMTLNFEQVQADGIVGKFSVRRQFVGQETTGPAGSRRTQNIYNITLSGDNVMMRKFMGGDTYRNIARNSTRVSRRRANGSYRSLLSDDNVEVAGGQLDNNGNIGIRFKARVGTYISVSWTLRWGRAVTGRYFTEIDGDLGAMRVFLGNSQMSTNVRNSMNVASARARRNGNTININNSNTVATGFTVDRRGAVTTRMATTHNGERVSWAATRRYDDSGTANSGWRYTLSGTDAFGVMMFGAARFRQMQSSSRSAIRGMPTVRGPTTVTLMENRRISLRYQAGDLEVTTIFNQGTGSPASRIRQTNVRHTKNGASLINIPRSGNNRKTFAQLNTDLAAAARLTQFRSRANNGQTRTGNDLKNFAHSRGYGGVAIRYNDGNIFTVQRSASGDWSGTVYNPAEGITATLKNLDANYIDTKRFVYGSNLRGGQPPATSAQIQRFVDRRQMGYDAVSNVSYLDANGDNITHFRTSGHNVRNNISPGEVYMVNGRYASFSGERRKNYHGRHALIDSVRIRSVNSVIGSGNVTDELEGARIVQHTFNRSDLSGNERKEIDQLGATQQRLILADETSLSVRVGFDSNDRTQLVYKRDGEWRNGRTGSRFTGNITRITRRFASGQREARITGFQNGEQKFSGTVQARRGTSLKNRSLQVMRRISSQNPRTEAQWKQMVKDGYLSSVTLYNRQNLTGRQGLNGNITFGKNDEGKVTTHLQIDTSQFTGERKKDLIRWVRAGGEGINSVDYGSGTGTNFRAKGGIAHGEKGMRVIRYNNDGARFEVTVAWTTADKSASGFGRSITPRGFGDFISFSWVARGATQLFGSKDSDFDTMEEVDAFADLMGSDIYGAIQYFRAENQYETRHKVAMYIDKIVLGLGSSWASAGSSIQAMGAYDKDGNGAMLDFFSSTEMRHVIDVSVFYEERTVTLEDGSEEKRIVKSVFTLDNGRVHTKRLFMDENGANIEKWEHTYNGDLTKTRWDNDTNNWEEEAYYDKNTVDNYLFEGTWFEVNETKLLSVVAAVAVAIVAIVLAPFTGGASLSLLGLLAVGVGAGMATYAAMQSFRQGDDIGGIINLAMAVFAIVAGPRMVSAGSAAMKTAAGANTFRAIMYANFAMDAYKYVKGDKDMNIGTLLLSAAATFMPHFGMASKALMSARTLAFAVTAAAVVGAGAGALTYAVQGKNVLEGMWKGAALFAAIVVALPVARYAMGIKAGTTGYRILDAGWKITKQAALLGTAGAVGGAAYALTSGQTTIADLLKGEGVGSFLQTVGIGAAIGAAIPILAAYFNLNALKAGEVASTWHKVKSITLFGLAPGALAVAGYLGYSAWNNQTVSFEKALAVFTLGAILGGVARAIRVGFSNLKAYQYDSSKPLAAGEVPAHLSYYSMAAEAATGWAVFGLTGVSNLLPTYDFGHTDEDGKKHDGKGWVWRPSRMLTMSMKERFQEAFHMFREGLRMSGFLHSAGFQPTSGITKRLADKQATGLISDVTGANAMLNSQFRVNFKWGLGLFGKTRQTYKWVGAVLRLSQGAVTGGLAGGAIALGIELANNEGSLQDVDWNFVLAGAAIGAGIGLANNAAAGVVGRFLGDTQGKAVWGWSRGVGRALQYLGPQSKLTSGGTSGFLQGALGKRLAGQSGHFAQAMLAGWEGIIPIHVMTQLGTYAGYQGTLAFGISEEDALFVGHNMSHVAMFLAPMPEFSKQHIQREVNQGNSTVIRLLVEEGMRAEQKGAKEKSQSESETGESTLSTSGEKTITIEYNGFKFTVEASMAMTAQVKTIELIVENRDLMKEVNNLKDVDASSPVRLGDVIGKFEGTKYADLLLTATVQGEVRSQVVRTILEGGAHDIADIINRADGPKGGEVDGFRISDAVRDAALGKLFTDIKDADLLIKMLEIVPAEGASSTGVAAYVNHKGEIGITNDVSTLNTISSGKTKRGQVKILNVAMNVIRGAIIARLATVLRAEVTAPGMMKKLADDAKKEIEDILTNDTLTAEQKEFYEGALKSIQDGDLNSIMPLLITMHIQNKIGGNAGRQAAFNKAGKYFAEQGIRVDGVRGYKKVVTDRINHTGEMTDGTGALWKQLFNLLTGSGDGGGNIKKGELIFAAEMGTKEAMDRVDNILGEKGEAIIILQKLMGHHLKKMGLEVKLEAGEKAVDGELGFMYGERINSKTGEMEKGPAGKLTVKKGGAFDRALNNLNGRKTGGEDYTLKDLLHETRGLEILKEVAKEAYGKNSLEKLTFEQQFALAFMGERVFYEHSKTDAAAKGPNNTFDGTKAVGQVAFVLNGSRGRISSLATGAGKSLGFGMVLGIQRMRGRLITAELLVALPQDVASYINDYTPYLNMFGLKLKNGRAMYDRAQASGKYGEIIEAYKEDGAVIVMDLDARGFTELAAKTNNAELDSVLNRVTVRGVDESDVAALSQKAFRLSKAQGDGSGFASQGERDRTGKLMDQLENALIEFKMQETKLERAEAEKTTDDIAYTVNNKKVQTTKKFYEFLKERKLVDPKGDGKANELEGQISNILRARHASLNENTTGKWYNEGGKQKYASNEYGITMLGTSDGSNTFSIAVALYKMRTVLRSGGRWGKLTFRKLANDNIGGGGRRLLAANGLDVKQIDISHSLGEATLSSIFSRKQFGQLDNFNFGGSATLDVAREIAQLIYGAEAVELQGSSFSQYGNGAKERQLEIRRKKATDAEHSKEVEEILRDPTKDGKNQGREYTDAKTGEIMRDGFLIINTEAGPRLLDIETVAKFYYGENARAEYKAKDGTVHKGRAAIEAWFKENAKNFEGMGEMDIVNKLAVEVLINKNGERITMEDITLDTSSREGAFNRRVKSLIIRHLGEVGGKQRATYGGLHGRAAVEAWVKANEGRLRNMTEEEFLDAARIELKLVNEKGEAYKSAKEVDIARNADEMLGDLMTWRADALEIDAVSSDTSAAIRSKVASNTVGRGIVGNDSLGRALNFTDKRTSTLNEGTNKGSAKGIVHLIISGYEGLTKGELLQALGRVGRSGKTKYKARRYLFQRADKLAERANRLLEIDKAKTKQTEGAFNLFEGELQKDVDQHRSDTKDKKANEVEDITASDTNIRRSTILVAEFNAAEAKSESVIFKTNSEANNNLLKSPLAQKKMEAEAGLIDGKVSKADKQLLEDAYNRAIDHQERAKLKPEENLRDGSEAAKEGLKGTLEQTAQTMKEIAAKAKNKSIKAWAESRAKEAQFVLDNFDAMWDAARSRIINEVKTKGKKAITTGETFADVTTATGRGGPMRLLDIAVRMSMLTLPSEGKSEVTVTVQNAPKDVKSFKEKAGKSVRGSSTHGATDVDAWAKQLEGDSTLYDAGTDELTYKGQVVAATILTFAAMTDEERTRARDSLGVIDGFSGTTAVDPSNPYQLALTFAEEASSFTDGMYGRVNASRIIQLATTLKPLTASGKQLSKNDFKLLLVAEKPFEKLEDFIVDSLNVVNPFSTDLYAEFQRLFQGGLNGIENPALLSSPLASSFKFDLSADTLSFYMERKNRREIKKEQDEKFAYRWMIHKPDGSARPSYLAIGIYAVWGLVKRINPWSNSSKLARLEKKSTLNNYLSLGKTVEQSTALLLVDVGGSPLAKTGEDADGFSYVVALANNDDLDPERIDRSDIQEVFQNNNAYGRAKFMQKISGKGRFDNKTWFKLTKMAIGTTVGVVVAMALGFSGWGLLGVAAVALMQSGGMDLLKGAQKDVPKDGWAGKLSGLTNMLGGEKGAMMQKISGAIIAASALAYLLIPATATGYVLSTLAWAAGWVLTSFMVPMFFGPLSATIGGGRINAFDSKKESLKKVNATAKATVDVIREKKIDEYVTMGFDKKKAAEQADKSLAGGDVPSLTVKDSTEISRRAGLAFPTTGPLPLRQRIIKTVLDIATFKWVAAGLAIVFVGQGNQAFGAESASWFTQERTVGEVGEMAVQAKDAAGEGLSSLFSTVGDFFSDLASTIGEFFSNLFTDWNVLENTETAVNAAVGADITGYLMIGVAALTVVGLLMKVLGKDNPIRKGYDKAKAGIWFLITGPFKAAMIGFKYVQGDYDRANDEQTEAAMPFVWNLINVNADGDNVAHVDAQKQTLLEEVQSEVGMDPEEAEKKVEQFFDDIPMALVANEGEIEVLVENQLELAKATKDKGNAADDIWDTSKREAAVQKATKVKEDKKDKKEKKEDPQDIMAMLQAAREGRDPDSANVLPFEGMTKELFTDEVLDAIVENVQEAGVATLLREAIAEYKKDNNNETPTLQDLMGAIQDAAGQYEMSVVDVILVYFEKVQNAKLNVGHFLRAVEADQNLSTPQERAEALRDALIGRGVSKERADFIATAYEKREVRREALLNRLFDLGMSQSAYDLVRMASDRTGDSLMTREELQELLGEYEELSDSVLDQVLSLVNNFINTDEMNPFRDITLEQLNDDEFSFDTWGRQVEMEQNVTDQGRPLTADDIDNTFGQETEESNQVYDTYAGRKTTKQERDRLRSSTRDVAQILQTEGSKQTSASETKENDRQKKVKKTHSRNLVKEIAPEIQKGGLSNYKLKLYAENDPDSPVTQAHQFVASQETSIITYVFEELGKAGIKPEDLQEIGQLLDTKDTYDATDAMDDLNLALGELVFKVDSENEDKVRSAIKDIQKRVGDTIFSDLTAGIAGARNNLSEDQMKELFQRTGRAYPWAAGEWNKLRPYFRGIIMAELPQGVELKRQTNGGVSEWNVFKISGDPLAGNQPILTLKGEEGNDTIQIISQSDTGMPLGWFKMTHDDTGALTSLKALPPMGAAVFVTEEGKKEVAFKDEVELVGYSGKTVVQFRPQAKIQGQREAASLQFVLPAHRGVPGDPTKTYLEEEKKTEETKAEDTSASSTWPFLKPTKVVSKLIDHKEKLGSSDSALTGLPAHPGGTTTPSDPKEDYKQMRTNLDPLLRSDFSEEVGNLDEADVVLGEQGEVWVKSSAEGNKWIAYKPDGTPQKDVDASVVPTSDVQMMKFTVPTKGELSGARRGWFLNTFFGKPINTVASALWAMRPGRMVGAIAILLLTPAVAQGAQVVAETLAPVAQALAPADPSGGLLLASTLLVIAAVGGFVIARNRTTATDETGTSEESIALKEPGDMAAMDSNTVQVVLPNQKTQTVRLSPRVVLPKYDGSEQLFLLSVSDDGDGTTTVGEKPLQTQNTGVRPVKRLQIRGGRPTQTIKTLALALSRSKEPKDVENILEDNNLGGWASAIMVGPLLGPEQNDLRVALEMELGKPAVEITLGDLASIGEPSLRNQVFTLVINNAESVATEEGLVLTAEVYVQLQKEFGPFTLLHTQPDTTDTSLGDRVAALNLQEFNVKYDLPVAPLFVTAKNEVVAFTNVREVPLRVLLAGKRRAEPVKQAGPADIKVVPTHLHLVSFEPGLSEKSETATVQLDRLEQRRADDKAAPREGVDSLLFEPQDKPVAQAMVDLAIVLKKGYDQRQISPQQIRKVWNVVGVLVQMGQWKDQDIVGMMGEEMRSGLNLKSLIQRLAGEMSARPAFVKVANQRRMPQLGALAFRGVSQFNAVSAIPVSINDPMVDWVMNEQGILNILTADQAKEEAKRLEAEVKELNLDDLVKALRVLASFDSDPTTIIKEMNEVQKKVGRNVFLTLDDLQRIVSTGEIENPQELDVVLSYFFPRLVRAIAKRTGLPMDNDLRDQLNKLDVVVMDRNSSQWPTDITAGNAALVRQDADGRTRIYIGIDNNSNLSPKEVFVRTIGLLTHEISHLFVDRILADFKIGDLGLPTVGEEALTQRIASLSLKEVGLEGLAKIMDLETAQRAAKLEESQAIYVPYKQIAVGGQLPQSVVDSLQRHPTESQGFDNVIVLVETKDQWAQAQRALRGSGVRLVLMDDILKVPTQGKEAPMMAHARLYLGTSRIGLATTTNNLTGKVREIVSYGDDLLDNLLVLPSANRSLTDTITNVLVNRLLKSQA